MQSIQETSGSRCFLYNPVGATYDRALHHHQMSDNFRR
jgi:hypothetical protein